MTKAKAKAKQSPTKAPMASFNAGISGTSDSPNPNRPPAFVPASKDPVGDQIRDYRRVQQVDADLRKQRDNDSNRNAIARDKAAITGRSAAQSSLQRQKDSAAYSRQQSKSSKPDTSLQRSRETNASKERIATLNARSREKVAGSKKSGSSSSSGATRGDGRAAAAARIVAARIGSDSKARSDASRERSATANANAKVSAAGLAALAKASDTRRTGTDQANSQANLQADAQQKRNELSNPFGSPRTMSGGSARMVLQEAGRSTGFTTGTTGGGAATSNLRTGTSTSTSTSTSTRITDYSNPQDNPALAIARENNTASAARQAAKIAGDDRARQLERDRPQIATNAEEDLRKKARKAALSVFNSARPGMTPTAG